MSRAVHHLVRALRWALFGLSWLVVAALVVISIFHLAHSEPRTVVLDLIAVTPWIYMLAWVTAAVGLWSHRRTLAMTSIVLVLLQLWWVVPDFDPIAHLAATEPGDAQIRLFDANVSQSNRDLSEVAGEIRRDRPQVVTMEELTPASLASLESAHVMGPYRYRLLRPKYGSLGMALWSVYPLADAQEWSAGFHPELRAWLDLPEGRRVRIDLLHTTAPYGSGQLGFWATQMDAIRSELAHEPRPLVAVGDLNATWYDWHFQALLNLGLRDAAVVAGQGWRMTWPRDQQPVVPYLRIDHVMITAGVSLESYSLGDGQGSDHHPVMVRVEVP